ncbi:MAG TPA: type II toxin-antitoxin system HipA family toxin [Cellvibrio sp.]|nr:type II toxin-antitoxin system HipA family toxin [Cellvibrio sp.]
MQDKVDVFVAHERAGRLARAQQRHSFSYGLDATEALSLTMPLRVESYDYEQGLHPLFQMNLPEGYLRQAIERFAAKNFGSDDLSYLTLLGNHQIGRLRYSLAGKPLPNDNRTHLSLTELLNSDDAELFHQLFERYAIHSGVAGVQPKVLMDVHSANHPNANPLTDKATLPLKKYIVKSWGAEFPELACNEFLCMTLARNAGLTTPNVYLSENGKLLVCERFDIDAQDQPLGFEDFCVLQGKTTQQKYESSIEACAGTVTQFVSPEYVQQALEDLFKLTLLNIQIRNGDAHLKNLGVLYSGLAEYRIGQMPGVTRKLAPLFDLVSTTPYIPRDSMALTLTGSKRWPKWKVLEKFAKIHCRLSNKTIEKIVSDVEQSCAASYPLLEQLMDVHHGFQPIGEAIGKLLQQRMV